MARTRRASGVLSAEHSFRIINGDVGYEARKLDGASFDAVLCDPPYGLSFMGRSWDISVPSAAIWKSVLGILKPGAPAIAFGGSRTFHRLAVEMELSGLELVDCFCWLYCSGFPKSRDASKAIVDSLRAVRPVVGTKRVRVRPGEPSVGREARMKDHPVTRASSEAAQRWEGRGTALKPAWEPALLFRRPLAGDLATNIAKHDVGALDIGASRVGTSLDVPTFNPDYKPPRNAVYGDLSVKRGDTSGYDPTIGRWPSNVVVDEETSIDFTFKGISRIFYTAKSSGLERDFGLEGFAPKRGAEIGGRKEGSAGSKHARASTTATRRNVHPTVKPIALAAYLARLLLPPPRDGAPRRILVPFSGSGSEMIGCLVAGWDEVVGIERDMEFGYVAIAEARLRAWSDVLAGRRPAPPWAARILSRKG